MIGKKTATTTTVVMTPTSAKEWTQFSKSLKRSKARKRRIDALFLDGDKSEAARIYELERPTMEKQAMNKKKATDEPQLQEALAASGLTALDNFLG